MAKSERPIFRPSALHQYLQNKEAAVLPRYVTPRTFICLWLLSGLLVAAMSVVWLVEVPVYASGTAVVVVVKDVVSASASDEIVVVVLLPPETLAWLQPHQRLWVTSANTRPVALSIYEVLPQIQSPNQMREQWSSIAMAGNQPAAVALARFEPPLSELPTSTFAGSHFTAEVEVGSRRVISLLPMVGHFFPAEDLYAS